MLSCPWCSSRMAPWHSSSHQGLQTHDVHEDHDTTAPTGTAIVCSVWYAPERTSARDTVLRRDVASTSQFWFGWLNRVSHIEVGDCKRSTSCICFWMWRVSRKGTLTLPYHGLGSEQWSLKISSRKHFGMLVFYQQGRNWRNNQSINQSNKQTNKTSKTNQTKKNQKNCTPVMSEKHSSESMRMI